MRLEGRVDVLSRRRGSTIITRYTAHLETKLANVGVVSRVTRRRENGLTPTVHTNVYIYIYCCVWDTLCERCDVDTNVVFYRTAANCSSLK